MNVVEICDKVQFYLDKKLYFKAMSYMEKKLAEAEVKKLDYYNELLYEYARVLFELGEYEKAFTNFVKLYNLSYKKEEILNIIFSAFWEPNKENIQQIYNDNKSKNILGDMSEFEDLKYLSIPMSNDKCYFFNKKDQKFCEILNSKVVEFNISLDYSDVIIIIEDYSCVYMPKKFEGIIYFISDNVDLLNTYLTAFELPKNSKTVIFRSFEECEKYFLHNFHISFPQNVFSDKKNREAFNELHKKLHDLRILQEERCVDSILLTVGVPSYNRGHRALELVNSFLGCNFDCEIEIVVSNNGSVKYEDEYNQIANIKDNRVKYCRLEENIGAVLNFKNVMDISNGKFVCLISDEDKVINQNLGYFLKVMRDNPNIGVIHTPNGHNRIDKKEYYKAGTDALNNMQFRDNYMSGLIYNRKVYNNLNISNFMQSYISKGNIAVESYPHSCWTLFAANSNGGLKDTKCIIDTGEPEIEDIEGILEERKPLKYMTLENRIDQHMGFVEVFKYFSENQNAKADKIKMLYSSLCNKTAYLINLNKNLFSDMKFDDIKKIYIEACLAGGEELGFKEQNIKEYEYIFNFHVEK